jgi:hypothetical protein
MPRLSAWTKVTDASVVKLAALKNLSVLYLGRTKVTEAGVAALNTALPKCKIER